MLAQLRDALAQLSALALSGVAAVFEEAPLAFDDARDVGVGDARQKIRRKLHLCRAVALGFVALGVWMTGLIWPQPNSTRAAPIMQMIWGWLSIVFFGFCAFAIGRMWWINEEQVRIGPAGIRISRWSDQTIPWTAITDVSEWHHKGTTIIMLRLHDPSAYPGGKVATFLAKGNRSFTGGDIGITMAGTNRSITEAMDAIENAVA